MVDGLDTTASASISRLPSTRSRWRTPSYFGMGAVLLGVMPLVLTGEYWIHELILCYFYMMAALSLRSIMISGQVPIAHGAFMGIGAYVSAMMGVWLDITPWLSIPASAILTMIIGIVVCFPFARLRALYYAMGTLFFGVAVVQVVNAGGRLTGGYSGLTQIPGMFGGDKKVWYFVAAGFLMFTAIALYRFEFSRIGIDLKAVAQSHVVAQSVGINEGFYRILAVAVGSLFVGLAGALYAHYSGTITTVAFNFMATMWIMMYVLVGGAKHFCGPIVGTFVLFMLPEAFREVGTYSPLIPAVLLLVVVYLFPGGFAAVPKVVFRAVNRRRAIERVEESSEKVQAG